MVKDAELVSENLGEMARALSGADAALIEDFLYSLFTPSEADEIAKRWALVKRIAEGVPQRDIAKELGLSLCKITRGSRELKKEGSSFRQMLERAGCTVSERAATHRRAARPALSEQRSEVRIAAPRFEARRPSSEGRI
jgi:TrpR family trp operon transcriptional repressor